LKRLFITYCVLILAPALLWGQAKTNLENYFQLIDNSVDKVSQTLPNEASVVLTVSGPASLELLKSKVFQSFSKHGYKVTSETTPQTYKAAYTFHQTNVEYLNAEKESFFGNIVAERLMNLKGNILLTTPENQVKAFEVDESLKDTVSVDEIKSLEDSSVPFTQGKMPETPFFSNLLEPVLVVGTLITTIILLFTVRGK